MLIIDGAKYKLWTPKDEEKEFHPMVKEHSKEIFGEDSLYFDVKHVLKTTSGIGSIPDAYVINLSRSELYVVENELASHPVYDHIVKQLTKFINGIENQNAKNQIIDMLYDEINKDVVLRATVQKAIDSTDVYRFISKLLSKPPRIVIIVDQKTPEIEEACKVLKYQPDIVEFQTFVREDALNVHAHLFEPLHIKERIKPAEIERKPRESKLSHAEEAVLEFVRELDHPANTTEVRDKFRFPSRDPVRRIFRKLHAMGYGENRKIGKRYLFYVSGKIYPEPPKEA